MKKRRCWMVISRCIAVCLLTLLIALPTQLVVPMEYASAGVSPKMKLVFLNKIALAKKAKAKTKKAAKQNPLIFKFNLQKLSIFTIPAIPTIEEKRERSDSSGVTWSFFNKTINSTRQLLWQLTQSLQKLMLKKLTLDVEYNVPQKIKDLATQDPRSAIL